jgi:hypothetical protein
MFGNEEVEETFLCNEWLSISEDLAYKKQQPQIQLQIQYSWLKNIRKCHIQN